MKKQSKKEIVSTQVIESVISKTAENLSDKLSSSFTDEPESTQVANLEQEIRDSFDNYSDKVITVRKIVDATGYSNVRVNNIMKGLVEEKFLVRTRSKGRFYYKRNVVESLTT